MIFHTDNSRYEVDEIGRRFRRFVFGTDGTVVRDGGWCRYLEAGHVRRGERVRFVLAEQCSPPEGRITVWTTTPVRRLLRAV